MAKEILQLENTNANDFKNEILNGVANQLKQFAKNLQSSDNENYLTPDETAKFLSVSKVTLWTWRKNNIIIGTKIGNQVRYKKQDIINAMQQMEKKAS